MTEEQHLREYTRALKPRLPRDAFQPVPRRLLWLPFYLGVLTLAAWGITQTDLLPLKLLLSLVIAQSFTALGFLAHEILHGQVTKNPLIRSITGTLAFLPLGVGARLWRKWHNVEHHGHTQHPEDDPDAMGTLEALRERPALQRFYRLAPGLRSLLTFTSFTFWFSLHAFMMFRRFLPEFKGHARRIVILQALLPILVWGGVLAWVGPTNWVFIYLLPLLIANFTVMSYIATNHLLNPLTHTNDPLLNSLTVRNPRWLEWLHLNFGYHTEHHVFPAMNPIHAPRVAALLKEMWPERYNELPHWKALYYLWKTPRLYRDERNLIELSTNRIFGTLGFGLEDTLDASKPQRRTARPPKSRAVD